MSRNSLGKIKEKTMNIEIATGEAGTSFFINGAKMVDASLLVAARERVDWLQARLAEFESGEIWESLAGRDREIAELKADLDHANEARADLGGEVTKLKNTMDRLRNEKARLENENAHLRNDLACLKNDRDYQTRTEIALRESAGAKIEGLGARIAELEDQLKCNSKAYAMAREGELTALEKIEELTAQVADLESQLKSERDASVYRLRVIVSEQAENVRLAKQLQDAQLEAKENERIADYWKERCRP